MCIVITYFPVDDAMNFEINLSSFYQVVFLHDRESQGKYLHILKGTWVQNCIPDFFIFVLMLWRKNVTQSFDI